MLRVGLTGGIGSGKSTVAARFADRGVPIIDTDEIARALVQPGQPALAEIARQFGTEVLDADGALDRAKMRERAFNHPTQRNELESILHPRIRAETLRRLNALSAPYIVVVVPLLVETDFGDLVDRVLVVDCDESLQVERAGSRSGLSPTDVRRVMAAQVTRQERLARADDVIENDGDLAQLDDQVTRLHQRYLALATN